MNFSLATHAHESQLRAMAAAEAMPGWVQLAFTREPSYFDGVAPQGFENQVVVLLDGNEVVGMGCRSIRRVYVHGQATDFGYLSGLRSKTHVRQHMLLSRGYRFLRELHQDGRVPGYLTTIVDDNRLALNLLTSGRAGLPRYLPCGRYHSYAIPLRRNTRMPRQQDSCDVRSGATLGAAVIADFLNKHGPARQFFPVITAADFGSPLLRDLTPGSFRVAMRGDTILGTVALWDQRAFRQTVVTGYARALQMSRPLINAALRLAGYRALPPPGAQLNMATLSLLCIRDNDPVVFAALLDTIRSELADSELHFLCVGLHERDTLASVLATMRHLRYDSHLYIVCWDDTVADCEKLATGRVPHVELAML